MNIINKLEQTYPNQFFSSIPAKVKQEAWQKSQSQQSNPVAKTNALVNYLSLYTLLPEFQGYFEDDYPDGQLPITIFQESSLSSVWEFVNGTVIEIKGNRLVLITDTNEIEDLCISQEWVDILSWQGDYFVAVQVNIPDGWVRVRGFVDYSWLQRFKDKEGVYDKQDRAYHIDVAYLTENIEDLLANLEPISQEAIEETPAPALTSELLAELGDRYLYYPRLAIPSDQWQSLLVSDRTRQGLYNYRIKGRFNDLIRLSDCFQGKIPLGYQEKVLVGKKLDANKRVKRLETVFDFELQNLDTKVQLTITLTKRNDGKTDVNLLVENTEENLSFSSELEVTVEDDENHKMTFKSGGENLLPIDLKGGTPGTRFSITLKLGNASFKEEFII